ncbi:unnamed protein product, partial [Choristocarpus tenellus]
GVFDSSTLGGTGLGLGGSGSTLMEKVQRLKEERGRLQDEIRGLEGHLQNVRGELQHEEHRLSNIKEIMGSFGRRSSCRGEGDVDAGDGSLHPQEALLSAVRDREAFMERERETMLQGFQEVQQSLEAREAALFSQCLAWEREARGTGGELREEQPIVSDDDNNTSSSNENEAVKNETVKNETVKNEAVKNETVKNETVKNEAVKNEAVKNETVRNETVSAITVPTSASVFAAGEGVGTTDSATES